MPRIIVCFFIALFLACSSGSPKNNDTDLAESDGTAIQDSLDVELTAYLMGHFNPENHPRFREIPRQYADREGMFLREEALQSFIEMHKSAAESGISLVIRSAARNFDYQKGIWERKWNGQQRLSSGANAATDFGSDSLRARKILEYSAMPGTSRHHWGTEIDLNSFNNTYFEKGEGLKAFTWLEKNAEKFGYCRPYTAKDERRPEGYNEEKWHWSYFPVSAELTREASRLLSDSLISGFDGSHVAREIEVVDNYILGIAPSCK